MPQQLLCSNAEIAVLLEAVIQEVFDDGGCPLGDRRAVILYNAVERWHRLEEMVRWASLEEFDHCAAHTPYVRGRRSAELLDDLRSHCVVNQKRPNQDKNSLSAAEGRNGNGGALTPIGTPNHRVVACARRRAARDTEVRKFDRAVFRRQNIRALDIAMNDTLIMQVYQPLKDLRDIYSDKVFGKLAEALAYIVQRAVLAEPGRHIEMACLHVYGREGAHSRIIYRYSRVLTNPLYLTILGCCREILRGNVSDT